eukprot:SAG31_NODE_37622_length_302_cov_2.246305_1_plen_41_part_10
MGCAPSSVLSMQPELCENEQKWLGALLSGAVDDGGGTEDDV